MGKAVARWKGNNVLMPRTTIFLSFVCSRSINQAVKQAVPYHLRRKHQRLLFGAVISAMRVYFADTSVLDTNTYRILMLLRYVSETFKKKKIRIGGYLANQYQKFL